MTFPKILVSVILFLSYNIIINGQFGSGSVVSAFSTGVGATTSRNHYLSYSNPVLGIKLSYPSNFDIQETTGNSVFLVGPNAATDVIVDIHLYRNVSFGPTVAA